MEMNSKHTYILPIKSYLLVVLQSNILMADTIQIKERIYAKYWRTLANLDSFRSDTPHMKICVCFVLYAYKLLAIFHEILVDWAAEILDKERNSLEIQPEIHSSPKDLSATPKSFETLPLYKESNQQSGVSFSSQPEVDYFPKMQCTIAICQGLQFALFIEERRHI